MKHASIDPIEYFVCALVFEAACQADSRLDVELLRARWALAVYLDLFHRPLIWRRQKPLCEAYS